MKSNSAASSRGGIVASMKLSKEQRAERSRLAGTKLLLTYGSGYYSALGKMPKNAKSTENPGT